MNKLAPSDHAARSAIRVRTAVRAGNINDSVSATAVGALVFQAPRPVQR